MISFSDLIRKPLLALLFCTGLWLLAPAAYAQTRTVTGKVVDENDEPVAGAYIVVKGETRGAMTDGGGRFTLDVKDSDILIVSFLSYEDEQVAVRGQQELLVKLVPQATRLEEAVAVAYGSQRKASVIGSISSVDVETLATPMGQLSTGLAGKLAGVVAMQRSGEPGRSAEFYIRGVATFGANSTPLILVDGVERSMDLVDLEDIASFSILKDATATAVYGVRGANGIVLITTRRGSESKPKVSVRMETGFTSPVKIPEMADTGTFIDYLNAIYVDSGQDAPVSEADKALYLAGTDPDLYPSVDWVHSTFKDFAQTHKINVNVTGGAKNVRYYVGGSYYYEDGILNVVNPKRYNSQMNYQRFNFRSNVDINITKSTVLGLGLSTQYTVKNSPGGSLGDILSLTMRNTPIAMPAIFQDGTLSEVKNTNNPYNLINESGWTSVNRNTAQSTITLTQDFSDLITEGLSAKVMMAWDAWNQTSLQRFRSVPAYSLKVNGDGTREYVLEDDYQGYIQLATGNAGTNKLNLEASVLYERQFAGAHRVSGMFLFNMESYSNNVPGSYLTSFPYKHMGIAGRATYSFKDRYFTEFNFGYNGSENFAPGHRFGFFPSVAVGYMISNEPFWEPLKDYVTELKFKGSAGRVGNDQIGGGRRFVYNATMLTSDVGGSNWGREQAIYTPAIRTGEIANPNVSWELATKFNAGFETTLFRELKYAFDWFYDKREHIFVRRESLPSAVGVNVAQYVNVGEMNSRGFDMSLNYDHRFANDLYLSLKGTYTFARNHVVYNDYPTPVEPYQNTQGYAYNQQRGLIAEGLFSSQEEIDTWPQQKFGNVRPGDIKYRDVNGDGVVDEYDIVPIGYTTLPEITYGFGAGLNWKGFDLSFFFNGVGHVTRIISGSQFWGGSSTTAKEAGQIYMDVARRHWSPENPDPNAAYPRLSLSKATNNEQASTFWQRDMSFLRLKNVEFGYTLPKRLTQKAFMSGVRFYVQGVNLLTFSSFKLWDPELDANYGNVYPMTRNITVGVNVNF